MTSPAERGDPAFDLLLLCSRRELDAAQRSRAEGLLAGGLDWDRLYALAEKHSLRPLLFLHLGEGRFGAIPANIEARLWHHQEQLRRRNQRMEREMCALLSALREAGIPALAHKGPVAAHHAYDVGDLREYGDLDLLMPERDIRRSREVLQGRGYVPKFPLSQAVEDAMLASTAQYHLMLVHREHGLLVELHWKTDSLYAVERSGDPGWWRRLPTMRIEGGEVPCLPPDEFLLALCLHGSKHYWGSLHWLVDVAELLRKLPADDWKTMWVRAHELGAQRRLALALRLAHETLEVRLPVTAHAWVDSVQGVRDLAREIVQGWSQLETAPQSARDRLRLDFALCDHHTQRALHLVRTLAQPGVAEWSRWPLPRLLHFLYVPLRIGGLFGRRLGMETAISKPPR
jgi:hypothetical protein